MIHQEDTILNVHATNNKVLNSQSKTEQKKGRNRQNHNNTWRSPLWVLTEQVDRKISPDTKDFNTTLSAI